MRKKLFIILLTALVTLSAAGASAKYLYEYAAYPERTEVARSIGIDNYTGTYDQNLQLLEHYEGLQGGGDIFGVVIPKVVALYEDSLQDSITASSTSLTLVSGEDAEGTSLSGTYGMIIDEGSADEEMIIATCAGTSCTSLTRGVSVADGETSVYALISPHRRGASIKVTDAPYLMVSQRLQNADEGYPNALWYSDQPSFSSTTQIVTKKYVDDVGAGGFTASNVDTDYGIQVFGTSPETVGIDLASLSGLRFDGDGDLQIATDTGSGIYVGSDDILKVATTSNFLWGGTHEYDAGATFDSTTDFNATNTFDGITYINGAVHLLTCGESIKAHQAVYNYNTSTRIGPAADTAATSTLNFVGFALNDCVDGETIPVQTNGLYSSTTADFATNTPYYVQAGGMIGNSTSTSGTFEGVVGLALNNSQLNMDYDPGWQFGLSRSDSSDVIEAPTWARVAVVYMAGAGASVPSGEVTLIKYGKGSGTFGSAIGGGDACILTASWDPSANIIKLTYSGTNCTAVSGTAYFMH